MQLWFRAKILPRLLDPLAGTVLAAFNSFAHEASFMHGAA
jgi:hypothetical protein